MRYVEMLVVADEKMAQFHGAGLERYLLTVMAAAAKFFRHPSLSNPVNLVVTRLVVLGQAEDGPSITSNAAQTLRNFCKWQQGLNKADDADPEHFDTAVLFTRQVLHLHPGHPAGRGEAHKDVGSTGCMICLVRAMPPAPHWVCVWLTAGVGVA